MRQSLLASVLCRKSHSRSAGIVASRDIAFEFLSTVFAGLHDIPIGGDDRSSRTQDFDLFARYGMRRPITYANLNVSPTFARIRMERALHRKKRPFRSDGAAIDTKRYPETSEGHKDRQGGDHVRSCPAT